MAETRTLQEILVTLGDKPLNLNVSIPGMKGENGQDGRNGADGLSAYDIAQLNGFTGSQQEWLESLKAGAVADEARTMLLNGNVWCKSAAISDVLAAVISNLGKAFPRTEFKPLTVPNVLRGQRVITVEGEPHYFVKVVGMETQFEIGENGTGSISIEPLGDNDVHLTYHNFTGNKVSDNTIKGVADENATPADDTFEENGVKYSLYGRKIVINATGYTGNNNASVYVYEPVFNFFGKWDKSNIDTIEIYSNKKKNLYINKNQDIRLNTFKDKVIYVKNPKNVTFKVANYFEDGLNTAFVIGTTEYGTNQLKHRDLTSIEWDETTNKYINTGYPIDHL